MKFTEVYAIKYFVIQKMPDFKNLEQALKQLRENVAEFSIGAVCRDDYRPTDEKIEILRKSIHRLSSRMITLKAKKTNGIVAIFIKISLLSYSYK